MARTSASAAVPEFFSKKRRGRVPIRFTSRLGPFFDGALLGLEESSSPGKATYLSVGIHYHHAPPSWTPIKTSGLCSTTVSHIDVLRTYSISHVRFEDAPRSICRCVGTNEVYLVEFIWRDKSVSCCPHVVSDFYRVSKFRG